MSLKSYRRREAAKSILRLIGIYVVGVLGAWINGLIILPAMGLTAPGLGSWALVTVVIATVSLVINLLKSDKG